MPWLKINKETESCEIEEEVEMNMARNFEKLLIDHPDICCEVEPKDYPPYLDYPKERKPMTNYDLLISKTPEELAKTIVGWLADVAELCGENRQEFDFTKAEEYAVSWLKSPMEE